MRKILFFSVALLFTSIASAGASTGFEARLGLLKYHSEVEGPQFGNSESTDTYYDFKLGYVLSNEIYVGGQYSYHLQDYGSGSEVKRTLYGATVGYHHNGWFIDGTYFLDGQMESGSTTYKKASGLGIDLGYDYAVNSSFFVGVEGSYKSFSFKEYSSGGTSITSENKVKAEYYPMLVIGVGF